jgi:hypothetical protein
MLITILLIAILIIAIVLLVLDGRCVLYLPSSAVVICLILIFAVGISLLGCLFSIGVVRATAFEEYQNMAYEKEVLEYRLEHIDDINDMENGLIYNDIVTFNNRLRHIKNRSGNIWTNWFANNIIAENIDYIEIPNSDFSPENIK